MRGRHALRRGHPERALRRRAVLVRSADLAAKVLVIVGVLVACAVLGVLLGLSPLPLGGL